MKRARESSECLCATGGLSTRGETRGDATSLRTAQIANTLNDELQPRGVAVVIDASHQCMTTRGVHKPGVTSIIIGAKTVEQLKQNIASTEVRLSAQEMAKLDEVSALPVEYPGWMLERQSADRSGLV